MITFKQFITELFNEPYEHEHVSNKNGKHIYHFKTKNDTGYSVHINHYKQKVGEHAQVHFDTTAPPKGKHGSEISGSEGHSASKVFGTVHHIIKKHLENHKSVKAIHFSASGMEPSRVKLYHHMARTMAKKYTSDGDKIETEFHIHSKDIK